MSNELKALYLSLIDSALDPEGWNLLVDVIADYFLEHGDDYWSHWWRGRKIGVYYDDINFSQRTVNGITTKRVEVAWGNNKLILSSVGDEHKTFLQESSVTGERL